MHKNATHNVPAYIIGEKSQLQWASDDGEPSGTSGAPMLHLLAGEGITNAVTVGNTLFRRYKAWDRRISTCIYRYGGDLRSKQQVSARCVNLI